MRSPGSLAPTAGGALLAAVAHLASLGCFAEIGGEDDLSSLSDRSVDGGVEEKILRVRPGAVGHRGLPLMAEPSSDSEELARIPALAEVVPLGESKGRWERVSYFHHRREVEMVGWTVREKLKRASGPPPRRGHNLLLPWRPGTHEKVNVAPHKPMHHSGHSRFAYDFDLEVGEPVLAAHSGVVSRLRKGSRTGGCNEAFTNLANYVAVNRGDGVETLYVHLKGVRVRKGQRVSRGQVLGKVGLTGFVCGEHLHFQVQKPGPDNRSVPGGRFWDSGMPWEPTVGSRPKSKNSDRYALP